MNESAYNDIPAGSIIFLDSGEIISANKEAAVILEFTVEELISKKIEELFTLPTRIFYQTHLYPLIRVNDYAAEIFITLLSKSGKHVPVLLNARRTENTSGTCISCGFIEVWNRKKFEDELVAARKEAERAMAENSELLEMKKSIHEHANALETQMQLVKKQNKELSEFSHAITHTFKEPLRKILMFSDMLKDEYNEVHFKKLLSSASQMKSVLSGMQRFLWLDEKENEFASFKCSWLVDAAVRKLENELPTDSFNINIENDEDLYCDGAQFQVLFYELFSNAVKFRKTDKAGINVSSTILNRNAFRHLEHHYRYEEYVRIDVTDNGMGFEEELKDQLFGLFKKLHMGEGTGIGLAICKKIADRHNGFIEAESRIGEFTKFSIWLPRTSH